MKKLSFVISLIVLSGCVMSHRVVIPPINESEIGNANAVIIFDSTFVNVKETGKYVKRKHVLVKILTMKGKAEFSSPSFTYMTKYGKVRVKSAYVVKKDGKVIKVKKDNIKDVKVPAFGKFFLPGIRMVKILFPDVERGDAIEYEVEEIINEPPLDGEFDDYVLFENREPVISKYYEVNIPKELYYKVYNDKNGEIKFKKIGTRYIWFTENQKPIVKEPLMPPLPDVGKKLLVSTVKSWKVWSKWYWNLTQDKFDINDTMKQVIDSLLKDAHTRLDTIKSLFYYVSNNVRYVATTMNGKKVGYEPFPATKTFRQKYGVCRDKAALLVSMLRHVGIEAYPVLTNPVMKVEKEIKADQFNHAIVAVKQNGKYIYLDPTVEDIPVFLPFYEQGKGVLVCTPGGEDLTYTEILPPDSNTAVSLEEFYLAPDGNLKAKSILKGSIIDQQFRAMVKKIPPERLKSIFSMSIQNLGSDATLDTLYYGDPDDFNTPFYIGMEYTVHDFAIVSDNKYVFSFTERGKGGGVFGANPFSLEERKFPLYCWTSMLVHNETVIHLPKGYTVSSLPHEYRGENAYVLFEFSPVVEEDSIIFRYTTCYKKPIIPPEAYQETKAIYDSWQKNLKSSVVLIKRETK